VTGLDLAPRLIQTACRRARAEGLHIRFDVGSGPQRYLTYGQLDLELARNAAPLAAFDNLTEHDFYSARIGCQTFGIYGMDLAALCIKRAHRPGP
jgi:hypothetical protein